MYKPNLCCSNRVHLCNHLLLVELVFLQSSMQQVRNFGLDLMLLWIKVSAKYLTLHFVNQLYTTHRAKQHASVAWEDSTPTFFRQVKGILTFEAMVFFVLFTNDFCLIILCQFKSLNMSENMLCILIKYGNCGIWFCGTCGTNINMIKVTVQHCGPSAYVYSTTVLSYKYMYKGS